MERMVVAKTTVTISATFGTEIQRDVSLRVLEHFLKAWQDNVESAHKGNTLSIEVEGDEAAEIE